MIMSASDRNNFKFFWCKGSANKADYFTKHHPSSHHQQVRPIYLREPHTNYYACFDNNNDDDDDDNDDDDINTININHEPPRNTHIKFLDQELGSHPTCHGEGVLISFPSHYPKG